MKPTNLNTCSILIFLLQGTYLDTIQPREQASPKKNPEIGQRIRLSEGDVAQTNLLYKCFRKSHFFSNSISIN
jgi:tolkin protein